MRLLSLALLLVALLVVRCAPPPHEDTPADDDEQFDTEPEARLEAPSSVVISNVALFAARPPCPATQAAAACVSRLVHIGPGVEVTRRYLLLSDIVDIEQIGNRYVVTPKDQHVVCTPRKGKRARG